MISELRFGIIGYGSIGKLHGRVLQETPGARLVAVADTNPSRSGEVDQKVLFFSDYQELLQSELEAVIIASPTALHFKAAIEALTRGKHVLVEKPMATTVEEAKTMCNVAREASRELLVGMTHRFYPELQEAKRMVDDGAVGDILMFTDTIIEPIGFLGLPPWYLDEQMAGGGVAMTDAIHLVDRLRWFAGSEVFQITGFTGNKQLMSSVEDFGQMFLWFTSDVTAQVTMTFMKAVHPLVCDLQVIGTKGSIIVHTWQGYTLNSSSGTHQKVIYQNEPHEHKVRVGLKAELKEFCDAIRGGYSPKPIPEDSLKALEIIRAFYRAAKQGTVVALS
jgi:predicted dehydrogenase